MNDANDNKQRSRESAYYHARKAKGDHLLRIWADPVTNERFKKLCRGSTNEETFSRIVSDAEGEEVLRRHGP